jgi:predicted dehydrogenase
MHSNKKMKIGVFGGRRGQTMIKVMARHPYADLVAICDKNRPICNQCNYLAKSCNARVTLYTDFDKFMDHDMDGVIVSNYATEHVPYAIRLLDSGRHVCSEVVACNTLSEAVALIDAVERSKKIYAFAENYCYFRSTLEMQKLYKKGDIGEFLHGEGEYVHDCQSIWPEITYGERNHWRNWVPPTFYCTHSMGPIMTVTGRRPARISAYETQNIVKKTLGARGADGAVIVCQMDNGATVKILPWCNFRRHPEAVWYCIYGSRGMMETDRWNKTFDRINVYRENGKNNHKHRSYVPPFPLQTALSKIISGHGGSDFYTMHYFLEAIRGTSKRNIIDVYQAVDMTLPGLLGYKSIYNGNAPIDIPNLKKKTERLKYRNDVWTVDPALAGPGQPRGSSREDRLGKLNLPDSIYRKQRALWRKMMK